MNAIKKSFFRKIIGSDTYDRYREFAKLYAPIYVIVTGMVFLLTRFYYWGFLCTIFSLLSGWSLFSLLFIISFMVLCNIECKGEETEYVNISNGTTWKEDNIRSKPYKLTIVWFVVLLALGTAFGILSNREKSHYRFQCTTYLVDCQNEIYHIVENDDCEDISNRDELIEMKGHEIESETDCQLCPACQEWHDDVTSTINSERHIRR